MVVSLVKCFCGKEIEDKDLLRHVMKDHSLKDNIDFITKGNGVEVGS